VSSAANINGLADGVIERSPRCCAALLRRAGRGVTVCRLDQHRSAKVEQVHELVSHVTSCFPFGCLAPLGVWPLWFQPLFPLVVWPLWFHSILVFDPVGPVQREHETRAMKRQLEEDFEREIAKASRSAAAPELQLLYNVQARARMNASIDAQTKEIEKKWDRVTAVLETHFAIEV
jgi:hypothetical protein